MAGPPPTQTLPTPDPFPHCLWRTALPGVRRGGRGSRRDAPALAGRSPHFRSAPPPARGVWREPTPLRGWGRWVWPAAWTFLPRTRRAPGRGGCVGAAPAVPTPPPFTHPAAPPLLISHQGSPPLRLLIGSGVGGSDGARPAAGLPPPPPPPLSSSSSSSATGRRLPVTVAARRYRGAGPARRGRTGTATPPPAALPPWAPPTMGMWPTCRTMRR